MAGATARKKRAILASARTGKHRIADVERAISGVHVSRRGPGQWTVIKPSSKRVSRTFSKKAVAIECAREIASTTSAVVYIHGSNGGVEKQAAAKVKR